MKRLFGKKASKGKRRISPSVISENGVISHPAYQYALNEFAQTVPPESSNDDGRSMVGLDLENEESGVRAGDVDVVGPETGASGPTSMSHGTGQQEKPDAADSTTHSAQHVGFNDSEGQPLPTNSAAGHSHVPLSQLPGESTPQRTWQQPAYHRQPRRPLPRYRFSEPAMPDATYEEWYGDAYVGGPIRYLYPSGYQSMRPRGGPWKLSIAVCLSFTWLSVFVIGHCSDRADQDLYQDQIDDDSLAIDTRWCGSRMLYLMWVGCMLITGLSTSYCCIIGYIKVRDFAVANSRSQPPGVVGRSDYYISIDDDGVPAAPTNHSGDSGRAGTYQETFYQADGTPQFWGGHIYRPTQAAVAVTSR